MKTKDITRGNKCKLLLGMSRSTANTKLHRELIWMLLQETGRTKCYRCGKEMTREDFSIEHKIPWMNSSNPKKLFWSLDNIDFSHLQCNIVTPRGRLVPEQHGTLLEYQYYNCRCTLCVEAHREYQRTHPRPSRVKRKEEREFKKSTHGTLYMYRYGKCRCEQCVAVTRAYWKKQRETRKQTERGMKYRDLTV